MLFFASKRNRKGEKKNKGGLIEKGNHKRVIVRSSNRKIASAFNCIVGFACKSICAPSAKMGGDYMAHSDNKARKVEACTLIIEYISEHKCIRHLRRSVGVASGSPKVERPSKAREK